MRVVWLLLVAGCGRIGFNAVGGGDDVVDGDGGTEAMVAGCKVGTETIVAPGTTDAWEAQLLWNGSRLGIAWTEAMGEFEIMFAPSNADGVPLTAAKNISSAIEHSWFPQLAWSGSEFAVVWSDDRTGNNDVRFARIDATTGARIGADV